MGSSSHPSAIPHFRCILQHIWLTLLVLSRVKSRTYLQGARKETLTDICLENAFEANCDIIPRPFLLWGDLSLLFE